ncbi:MAG TPA: hypothetical protein VFS83_15660 [Ktedonobacterales bacterium]|nr:hypothetical protein [Ktedonobacterales bacterium]
MSRARASSRRRQRAQPSTADPTINKGDQRGVETGGVAIRLIPALPAGAFVAKPDEIDRFVVRILPDGSLYFKGSRARIDDFIAACNEVGLELHISHIALCG